MPDHSVISFLEECGFLPTLHFAVKKFKQNVVQASRVREEEPYFKWVTFDGGRNAADDPYRISVPGFEVDLFHFITKQHVNEWCIPNARVTQEQREGHMAVGVAPYFYPSLGPLAKGGFKRHYSEDVFHLETFNFIHDPRFRPISLVMQQLWSASASSTLGTKLRAPTHATHRIEYEYQLDGSTTEQVVVQVTFKLPAQAVASSAHSLAHAVERRRAGERVRVLAARVY